MKYKINKLELTAGLSLWIVLSIVLSLSFDPGCHYAPISTVISIPMPSTVATAIPVAVVEVRVSEMAALPVNPVKDKGLHMAMLNNTVKPVQAEDEVLPYQVLKKGDAYDDGVVFYASADEIITMTVRADGVKFFENHLVG
jgi:hypothetical protein